MNKFLSVISDIRVVIAIAILVIILTMWLVVEKIRTKRYRHELEELESRYNEIKSVPPGTTMKKSFFGVTFFYSLTNRNEWTSL